MANLVDILMPADSQEGTTATLTCWLHEVGQRVAEYDALAELETDKVNVEVPAPATGVLAEILKNPGDSVNPGELLGRIRVGDAAAAPATSEPAARQAAPAAAAPTAAPVAVDAPRKERRLSPAVRRLISEHGLDPHAIPGSGKDGRLTKQDVLGYLDHAPAPAAAPRAAAPRAAAPVVPRPAGGSRMVPHNGMRRSIAAHMVGSLLETAPHVTALFEMDMTAVMRHRAAHKAAFAAEGVPLTITAYFVLAAVEALRAVPEVNSRWHDDALELFADMHIGVGTALGDKGLIVPVIRDAQNLGLRGVAAQLSAMTDKARAGKLAAADISGGTFTISNHGVSGSLLAAPIIINQPQSAILGVGKLQKRVVVVERDGEDAMQIRPMCFVTLTIDHRALDAWHCNTFLTRFVEVIEGWR